MVDKPSDINQLKRIFPKGRVKTSRQALIAYSTDAGLYKIVPRAIVMIEEEEDVKKVLKFARDKNIPITARGAGSSCVGGAIGPGIILDFTRFNKILKFNSKKKEVIIQPGIIYQHLNKYLAKLELMFAPDPASGDFCRLGGMIANNASGPQTVKYGTTKDYVKELKIYLLNGKKIIAKKYKTNSKEFREALKKDKILKSVYSLVKENKELLKRNAPNVKKNASGYNLFDLALGLERGEFDYPKLFVGSEGTLGIIVEATLGLVPTPKKKVTALIYLNRLNDAGHVVKKLMPLEPSAIEILDTNAMDVLGRSKYDIPETAQAMLLLEFNEGDLKKKVESSKKILKNFKLSSEVEVAFDNEKQDRLWRARRAALPALSAYDPKKKPIPFVEDGTVPTEKVPEYIKFLGDLFGEHGIKMGIYGHIGDGNTHIRPLMDVNSRRDRELLPKLAHKVHRKVKELGGSLSGEHGDGRTTTQFLEEYFGYEVYELMKKTKELFDPECLLNPDVIISTRKLTDEVDFEKYLEDCGTCGKCNPYCPVFCITSNEEQGPRGLFRLIKSDEFSWDDSKDLIENCLDCKLCGFICPAGTDPSDTVVQERTKHKNALVNKFDDRCNGFACGFIKTLAPKMMRKKAFNTHEIESEGDVAYFYGCAANMLNESIPEDTLELLDTVGVKLAVPEQLCCGAPYLQFGDQNKAKELARFNIASLSRFSKIITTCPHCTQFIKEYHKMFETQTCIQKARMLAEKVVDVSELIDTDKLKLKSKKRVVYQEPCYLRIDSNTKPCQILKKVANLTDIDSGCCGASLGYPLRNKKMADKILKSRLKALDATKANTIITSCPHCLVHMKNEGKSKAKHLVSFLNSQMEK